MEVSITISGKLAYSYAQHQELLKLQIPTYDLKFSVANRTLFSKKLRIVHWDGFQKATIQNFPEHLPIVDQGDIDGYLIHSVELTGESPQVYKHNDYLVYIVQTYARHITRFSGSFDEFLQGVSAKTRSTLRRKVRKFARESENNEIDWREYNTAEEIESFMGIAIPLASKTYQAKLLDSALPSTPEFLKESLQAASQGKLRAYILFRNQQAVAYLYTPITENSYVYEYLGYDELEAHRSPGSVLQYLVHEKLFTEARIPIFDFTEGDGAHKALFGNESTRCANVLYLKDTLKNHVLIQAHRCWTKTIETLKVWAEDLNLRVRLKRIFR